jgi:hypothetical protein
MFAMPCHRIGAVGRLVALWGEVTRLVKIWPTCEGFFQLAVVSAHLLETHNIGIKLLHRVAQIVNFQAT